MFRKHQDEFGEVCSAIRNGQAANIRSIICSITPGGGKSMLPVIAASQLLGQVADHICWVVPRRSLQQQAEQEFIKARGRDLLGHRHTIRRSTNETDPCRGLAGFVTTYQALGFSNAHLLDEFARRRYILVLDEPHHIEEGGAWEAALAPLVRRAALTVYMSGTLERGNKKRIAFLPYDEKPDGDAIDLRGGSGVVTISYNRRDALLDRAIVPIHFELMDGTASWIGRDGETYSTRLSEAGADTSEAIYTAVKTQFAYQLLDDACTHWANYRLAHPRSKLLVVTANIEDAKKYLAHVRRQGIAAAIATSDDSAQAARNIELYRSIGKARSLEALVTVAMAYEGLDVPPITHIACLTHIRSKPWIEQMIARATRFDEESGRWSEQMAHVYVPDDRNMCAIIARLQDDQMAAIELVRRREEQEAFERLRVERDASAPRVTITPVGSQIGRRRWSQVGTGISAAQQLPQAPRHTPSQQEAELRDQIQSYCKQVDLARFDRRWGETNKRVVKQFKRSRADMTLQQLNQVKEWLERNYPLEAVSVH